MTRSRELAELASAYDGDGSLGFRNRLINGGMGIWQRGTTFSAVGYAQDRWFLFAPSGSVSASRSTDVPSGFQFSAEMTGTNVSFTQRIESANCFYLVGGSVTVSFWAKNVSGTQDLFVALQNPTAVDNWTSLTEITSAQVSASPSTNWTYYTITFNSLPAGVANGLSCVIGRGAGGSTTTRITGVQLEAGSVATPFERRPYGTELALCQRYYEKTYDQSVVPGTANDKGAFFTVRIDGIGGGGTSYKVTKRAAPTIVFYSPTSGTAGQVRNYSASSDTAGSPQSIGDTGFYVLAGSAGAGSGLGVQWTASAEL